MTVAPEIMKVAIVTYAMDVGGMETFLFGLARQLRAQGMEPTFVITDYIGRWHEKLISEGFQVLAVLPGAWRSKDWQVRELANALKGFDVALLNHSRVAQSALGLLPESVAAIAVLHNDTEEIYSIGLANRKNLDFVVAVSERLRRESLTRGVCAEQLRCIRIGVEVLGRYPKTAQEVAPGKPLQIAFVGRIIHRQKGVLYLPGILQRLAESGVAARCDIVGGGEDLERLRMQLETKVAPGVATLHGVLPHARTMDILQCADVLLMPSHYEGQGLIVFEAMMRGVIPVVTRLKDITDTVISDGENGVLVATGDEIGFAGALATIAGEPGRLARMSRAAWQTAQREYGEGPMARQYADLFTLCHEKRSRGAGGARTGAIDYSLLGHLPGWPGGVVTVAAQAGKIMANCRKLVLTRAGLPR